MLHLEKCLLFGMPGPFELIVILLIILLVVGPKRLPELMKSIGKSLKSFKQGMREADMTDDLPKEDTQNDDKPAG